MATTHTVIKSEPTTLPKPNGDRDVTISFDTPDRPGADEARRNRPLLCYRVNARGDEPVRFRMKVNSGEVADLTLRDSAARTFIDVFDHDLLDHYDNQLVITVPDDHPGTLVVSNIVVQYVVEDRAYEPHTGGGGPL